MALPFFQQGSFSNTANMTPDQIERKRAYIAAMMPKFGSAKYVGEGLGQLATGFAIRKQNKKLDAAEGAGRESADKMFERIFGTANSAGELGGQLGVRSTPSGTWTPAAPGPTPVDIATQGADVAKAGGLSFGNAPKADTGVAGQEPLDFGAAVMTPQEMLIEGAKRRGLDPIDVATAISYETGGKFDPMLAGPTTQWGTHRGLIQFGEPQAAQNGVDFSNPDAAWRSQLNPENGAVWNYLEGAGVQPGMGLDQIYSGINAGSVGRMGASDANNGGAPGTVADKVAGMGPHRENAAKFLGGTWTPAEGGGQTTTYSTKGGNYGGPQGGGVPMAELQMALMNPWLTPEQKSVVQAEYTRQMQQSDPMYQIELQKAQMELDKAQNPTQEPPEDFTARMFTLNSLGIDPQSEEGKVYIMTGKLAGSEGSGGTEYGLTPQYGTDKDGNLVAIQFANDGTSIATPLPEGVALSKGIEKLDLGTHFQYVNSITGEKIGDPVSKNLAEAESQKAIGKAEGEATGAAITGLGAAESKATQGIALIDSIINDPALSGITGMIQGNLPPLSQAGTDLNVKIGQVQGKAFLEAFDSLKGGGAISEREGEAATAAIARLDRAQSTEAYQAALAELKDILQTGLDNMRKKAGSPDPSASDLSDDDLKYLEE